MRVKPGFEAKVRTGFRSKVRVQAQECIIFRGVLTLIQIRTCVCVCVCEKANFWFYSHNKLLKR